MIGQLTGLTRLSLGRFVRLAPVKNEQRVSPALWPLVSLCDLELSHITEADVEDRDGSLARALACMTSLRRLRLTFGHPSMFGRLHPLTLPPAVDVAVSPLLPPLAQLELRLDGRQVRSDEAAALAALPQLAALTVVSLPLPGVHRQPELRQLEAQMRPHPRPDAAAPLCFARLTRLQLCASQFGPKGRNDPALALLPGIFPCLRVLELYSGYNRGHITAGDLPMVIDALQQLPSLEQRTLFKMPALSRTAVEQILAGLPALKRFDFSYCIQLEEYDASAEWLRSFERSLKPRAVRCVLLPAGCSEDDGTIS